jgi:uncharacterized repeat protein (TIGR03803 family)
MIAGCNSGLQSQLPTGTAALRDIGGIHLRYDPLLRSSGRERVIHAFNGEDGWSPHAALLDVRGTLYGTTWLGAIHGGNGDGTVYKMTPSGQTTMLYQFHGPDGSNPAASLIDVNGTLYGTTVYGGAYCGSAGCGTVFSITPSGTETVLHSFGSAGDGATLSSSLTNVGGTLYGTTLDGGTNGDGAVFSITPSGVEHVVYSFAGSPNGEHPDATLINVNGRLYGTTASGGASGDGTVFSVSRSGRENVLHSFSGSPDGSEPAAALTNVNGTLYGTTDGGGSGSCSYYGLTGCGTVFSIDLSGNEKVIYSFAGSADGANPRGNLLNVSGTLYGTSAGGGSRCAYYERCGTVFSITLSGNEQIVHRFKGGLNGHADGSVPEGGLIDVRGRLYGATGGGGANGCGYGSGGCGTVFRVTP